MDLGGADPAPPRDTGSEPSLSGINTFNDFTLLESVSFEMPILFGACFLEEKNTSDQSREALANRFRESLVENLPTSLRSLRISYCGAFQESALDAAVERLDEVRERMFVALDTVEICEDEVDDI